MLFYCGNCKTVLQEDELEEYEESRGEYLGTPCWETFMVCPLCGTIPREYNPYVDEGERKMTLKEAKDEWLKQLKAYTERSENERL